MERNGSSWAEQWDYNHHETGSGGGGGGGGSARSKYTKKFGEGFAKTKAVASTGVKKMKGGASLGLHWIKDKYQKTTRK